MQVLTSLPPAYGRYAYFWWGNSQAGSHSHYYAHGNLGQYIYVIPEQQLIFVRFGKAYGGVGIAVLISIPLCFLVSLVIRKIPLVNRVV